MACGVSLPCWEGEIATPSTYSIWNRIMLMSEKKKGAGVLCAREGIDLVAQCRENLLRPDTRPAPGFTDWMGPGDGKPSNSMHMDINVTDCDVVASAVDPFCSFSTAGNWLRNIHAEIKQNQGWTLDFWFKVLEGTKMPQSNDDYRSDPESMRRFAFFNKVSPPRVFAALEIRADLPENTLFSLWSTCEQEFENIDYTSQGMYRVGEWFHVALVFGARNAAGLSSNWESRGTHRGTVCVSHLI
jgi:hypothetical protein